MKDITIDDFYEFINYLQEECDYNVSTVERIIGRIKFFCNRSSENGIKISPAYLKRIYLEKEEDIDGVYLNEDEISKIYNLQIENEDLDNAKDNLVLSCYLGLRVSDFMFNLNIDNIKDNIVSVKTKKTGAFVKIPLHPYCKQILNKRFGQLPKRFSEYEYNTLIKNVGQIAEIDNLILGSLWDSNKKRKVKGYHAKYKFFSSHIGRRSFSTNLSGKVSDEIIMACAGWSQVSMKNHYNKKSKQEYAEQLNQFWQK
jgi:integrase